MTNSPLPLFNWRSLSEAERLRRDREALLNRIKSLRPHAFKRVVLEDRLKLLTLRQIEIELGIEKEASR